MQSNVKVFDNRAPAGKCFNPEYTFVEKLQTICKKYRQHQDRNSPEYDQPKQFLRHYYDLYKLLNLKRVQDFIETGGYSNLSSGLESNISDESAFIKGDILILEQLEPAIHHPSI